MGQIFSQKEEEKKIKQTMAEWKANWEKIKPKIEKLGRIKLTESVEYQGQVEQGRANGFGIYFFINKNNLVWRYEGQIKDWGMHGKGILFNLYGYRYEGQFKDGLMNGKGIEYWNEGHKSQGEWKNNKKNGKSVYYWDCGAWQEGERKDDKPSGKTIFFGPDGRAEEEYVTDEQVNRTKND